MAQDPGRPARNVAQRRGATLERGTAGRSADAEYRRRLARDAALRKRQYGPFAWVVTALAGERQSTRAWSTGADGERRVGAELERALGVRGIVLHDRRLPGTRGNIDHIAVAPSGVWIVDAKEYRGRVESRDVGGWLTRDVALYVGRRDRSSALEGVRRQRDKVGAVLHDAFGDDAPALHAAICLVGAEWAWFARPMRFDGVWVTWPRRLGAMLLQTAVLDAGRIERVAGVLARRFPVR